MLKYNPDNPKPQIGQLLYKEYADDNGNLESASLVFVDDEISEGGQWMYTQIAYIEDRGSGAEVYLSFESGGMPPKYTRIASDDDLRKVINLINSGKLSSDSETADNWIQKIKSDNILLESEKNRISEIFKSK